MTERRSSFFGCAPNEPARSAPSRPDAGGASGKTLDKPPDRSLNAETVTALAEASHHLRQPLHALGFFLASLRERASAEQQPLIARIDEGLNTISSVLDTLSPGATAAAAQALDQPAPSAACGLLVEADASRRDEIRALLEAWGYDVTLASSAAEAIAALDSRERPYDFVLSTLKLGLFDDGLQVTDCARGRSTATRLLLMVDSLASGDRQPPPADDVTLLAQPVLPARLRAALAQRPERHVV
jgi:CheY-like chemotaxis protein